MLLAGTDGHIYTTDGKQQKCYRPLVTCGQYMGNIIIHHLIALAFYGERLDGHDVDRIYYNKVDNRPDMSYQIHLFECPGLF